MARREKPSARSVTISRVRAATIAYIVFMVPKTAPTPMTRATKAARRLSVLAMGPASLQNPGTSRVKQTAYAHVEKARAIARDAQLVSLVAAKNAEKETRDEIRRKDAEWIGAADHPLRHRLTKNECAGRLRSLVADDGVVVEVLLMDQQGALVCASVAPSDYWQGDEPKWQKTCLEGRDPFVDEPSLDASTNQYAIQLSVPVKQDGSCIGAVPLTLRVPRDVAAPRS